MDLYKARKILKFRFLIFGFISCLLPFVFCLAAQEQNEELVALTRRVMETKDNRDLYLAFEDLTDLYLKENKYSEFVDFLNSLASKKKTLVPTVNYYIALARYYQLKYLEKSQNWDEYFSKGNAYRDQITVSLKKTMDSVSSKDALSVYSRLILWKFHADQQDSFSEAALSNLMKAVAEYSKKNANLELLRDVAGEFNAYGEKAKAKELYKIYVDGLTSAAIQDEELNKVALGFYEEGNLELSELVYDLYMDRITKSYSKEKRILILKEIAQQFSYYKDGGVGDALYAEKIFKKIDALAGKEALDEDLMYLRAFNLEKTKEYQQALDCYLNLAERYPQSVYTDEAFFKAGMIYAYALKDWKRGRGYFEKIFEKGKISPQAVSSLYQVGLFCQWEQEFGKAKGYYYKLIEMAKGGFGETVALAQERLKEIEQSKPMEYNLKTFLDLSLKEENSKFDMTKLGLKSSPYRPKKEQGVEIAATPYLAESGCMQVELEYLWSGNTGTAKPSLSQQSFNTTYKESGTKEISLVVVSPSGIIDRSFDLIDVP